MLDSGQIQRVHRRGTRSPGLTSNPSIFDKAIESGDYDDAIREKARTGLADEALFFDLAIEDLRRAADAVPADPRAHRRRGRLGVARGLAAAGVRTRQRPSPRPRRCTSARRAPTCSSRSPARRRALSAIEECDRRGRPDQRHPAVLAPISTGRRPRPICAGIERRIAAELRPARRVGRVGVHVAVGRRRPARACPTS